MGDDERHYLRLLPKHLRLDFQDEPRTLSLLMVYGSPRRVTSTCSRTFQKVAFGAYWKGLAPIFCFWGIPTSPITGTCPTSTKVKLATVTR